MFNPFVLLHTNLRVITHRFSCYHTPRGLGNRDFLNSNQQLEKFPGSRNSILNLFNELVRPWRIQAPPLGASPRRLLRPSACARASRSPPGIPNQQQTPEGVVKTSKNAGTTCPATMASEANKPGFLISSPPNPLYTRGRNTMSGKRRVEKTVGMAWTDLPASVNRKSMGKGPTKFRCVLAASRGSLREGTKLNAAYVYHSGHALASTLRDHDLTAHDGAKWHFSKNH